MSKAPQRGKLRNPPRGRMYGFVALGIIALLAIGSGAFLYTTHSGPFQTFSTSSTSTTSASTSSGICSPSTTTSTVAGTNGTYALICTNLGLIEVQLFPDSAPKTVANFVSLAKSGFYDGLVWHRIVP